MFSTIPRANKIGAVYAALIIFMGIVRFPCDDYRELMRILFEISVPIALSVLVWRHNQWVALFLIAATVSKYFPFYTRESSRAADAILCGVVWYLTILELQPKTEYLLNAMCVLGLVNAFLLICQTYQLTFGLGFLDLIFEGGLEKAPVGLTGNQNMASAVLAFTFFAFLRRKWVLFLPVILGGLVLAKSVGGVLAVGVGCAILSAYMGDKGIGFLVIAMIITGYLILVHIPDLIRLKAWKTAIWMSKEHWLSGGGIGHFKIQFPRFIIQTIKSGDTTTVNLLRWDTLHNEILQGWFEMGMMFAVPFAGYIAFLFKKFTENKIMPAAALIAVFVNSLVNFPFHVALPAMLGLTWMAIYERNA